MVEFKKSLDLVTYIKNICVVKMNLYKMEDMVNSIHAISQPKGRTL